MGLTRFKFAERTGNLPELTAETTEKGRYYTTPDGNVYPSVTTVLSINSKSGIEKWQKKVGDEQAERIRHQAALRGEKFHDVCEKYLKSDENHLLGHNSFTRLSFETIQPILDKNVEEIDFVEAPLYSDIYHTAGRVDCICKWNGKWVILDFKTSRKKKKRKWISNYFCQASIYAQMYYELTGIRIEGIVILIYVDHEDPQIFEENTKPWLKEFAKARYEWEKEHRKGNV